MRKIKNVFKYFILGCTVGAFIGVFHSWIDEKEEKERQIIIKNDEEIDLGRLTRDNVYYWLNYFGVQYPEIVLAQSILECGWDYESFRAQEMNNIFGFETGKKVLEFHHWIGCIVYYKKWQDNYYHGGDYYIFLQDYVYAEDSNYVKKLKQIIELIKIKKD